jgi:hypothetical protein
MGEFADLNDTLRDQATDEMQEILDSLEELKGIYTISNEHFNKIERLVIDKGLEIGQLHNSISSLEHLKFP